MWPHHLSVRWFQARVHAYCEGDSRAAEPDVLVDGKAYCPVCGQEW
jgi:hypothetical protein